MYVLINQPEQTKATQGMELRTEREKGEGKKELIVTVRSLVTCIHMANKHSTL